MLKTKLSPLAISEIRLKSDAILIDPIQTHVDPTGGFLQLEQISSGNRAVWGDGAEHVG